MVRLTRVIESLWGTGNIGVGWKHAHMRDDQRAVRLLLHCLRSQLIAVLIDRA